MQEIFYMFRISHFDMQIMTLGVIVFVIHLPQSFLGALLDSIQFEFAIVNV